MEPGKVYPGLNSTGTGVESVALGSATEEFSAAYATNFYGISEKASALVSRRHMHAPALLTVSVLELLILLQCVRDGAGNLNAVLFQGTATSARYADLAEKYTTAEELASRYSSCSMRQC